MRRHGKPAGTRQMIELLGLVRIPGHGDGDSKIIVMAIPG